MIDLSPYDALIFDMDGTLIDSMPAHLDAWEISCQHFGYAVEREFIHALGGVPSEQTARILNEKFGLNHDPKEVSQHKIRTWESLGRLPEIIEETVAIARDHHGKKPMGVGTGSKHLHAREMLAHTQIDHLFDALVASCDVENGKPHPETFLKVAQALGAEPRRCVVFEDTQIGLQAAHAGGMDCILVTPDGLRLEPFIGG